LAGKALLGSQRRQFARDERGATAVEFGLLALPFFMIIGAILETSVVFLSGQVLDSAVQDVSRLIRTGQIRELGINSVDTFKSRVCDRLYGLFSDCDELHVEVNVVTNFSSATISPPVNTTACAADKTQCAWSRSENFSAGQGNSIVVVQVYYKWPVVVGLGGYNIGNLSDNTRLMGGTTILRNEPFT
jgi:Flp pilus assembly protein TadG